MKCKSGHDSDASDFCSECGLEMEVAAGAASDDDLTPVPRQPCPVCTSDRDDPSTPFCGVCGYNFATKAGGHVVAAKAAATPAAKAPAKAAAPSPTPRADYKPAPLGTGAAPTTAARIEIELTYDETKPEAPKGEPVRKFSLYDEECLLGRRSSGIAQTVGIDGDDFISRRHLLIIRQSSGYVVRLFDNTNGGTLNGKELVAGVESRLAVGDKLTIGSYTIIRVSAIRT